MGSCSAKLIADKIVNPSIPKRNGIFLSFNAPHYVRALSAGRIESNPFDIGQRIYFLVIGKALNKAFHAVLQCGATSNYDAQRDGTIRVQSLEVLQIAIKKRVLVVPFDFKGYRPAVEWTYVIDLVRLGLALNPVNDPLNAEIVLKPAANSESVPEPLCAFGFASS